MLPDLQHLRSMTPKLLITALLRRRSSPDLSMMLSQRTFASWMTYTFLQRTLSSLETAQVVGSPSH